MQSAPKHVANNIEFIESFDSVIICFDNDAQGKEASVKVAKLISPAKAEDNFAIVKRR